ncbi:RluA family pseudouridine synthase [bacterium]|jgi:23S rRNA pseudouridine1911/1915/1917 synthase|nr:RluA family pseudouridine synthase [bacterium]
MIDVNPANFKLDLLHEDPNIIVLNKPINLNVHKGNNENEITLVDILKAKNFSLSNMDSERAGIVHRLDKLTEGLMVIAKTELAYEHLVNQFKSKDIHKKYYAMVYGNVLSDEFEINKAIKRHPSKRHRMICHTSGKASTSIVSVLKRFNSKTFVSIRPITGRTHQIRVHMEANQHPVIGDPVYFKSKPGEAQLLQAYSLSFIHPTKGNRLTFVLPSSKRFLRNK